MVKIKKSASDPMVASSSEAHYPYGTQLDFSDDLVDDLGIGNLVPGDHVMVKGMAVVKRRSESMDEDGTDKYVCLQLTDVDVKRKEDDGDRVKALYGES